MTETQIEQFTRAMCGLIEGLELRSRALRIHSDRVITVDADGDINWYTRMDAEGAIIVDSDALLHFSDGREETDRWIIEHPEEVARDYIEVCNVRSLIDEAVAELNAPEPEPIEQEPLDEVGDLILRYSIHLLRDGGIGAKMSKAEYAEDGPRIERHKAAIIAELQAQAARKRPTSLMDRRELLDYLRQPRAKGERVDLYGRDLRNMDLRGADLSKADMCRTRLTGARLDGANLEDATLREADARGASFAGARMRGVSLYKARLEGACLRGCDMLRSGMRSCNLRGADLSGSDLRRAEMFWADLTGADLTGAIMTPTDIQFAQLSDEQVATLKVYQR